MFVGAWVEMSLGKLEDISLGALVVEIAGAFDGESLGKILGAVVGVVVGFIVESSLITPDGTFESTSLGKLGTPVGAGDGESLGIVLGKLLGVAVLGVVMGVVVGSSLEKLQ